MTVCGSQHSVDNTIRGGGGGVNVHFFYEGRDINIVHNAGLLDMFLQE